MENFEKYLNLAGDFVVTYGLKLIGALVALILGLLIIRWLTNVVVNLMEKKNVDESLRGFLKGLFNITLKILLIVSVAAMVGIQMTAFIALIGAIGLAFGLALSGTLQNFAGGVIILLLKPFKTGDFIEAQNYMGSVREIQIFNTILKTPDNKTVIIPNGGLSTGTIVNFSTEKLRRIDMTFGIGYGDDTEQGKEVIMKLIGSDDRILKEPEPFVAVSELADSSVNFAVRVWVDASDYWAVFFDMQEKIYKTFNKEGLNIPFPQMDVYVHKEE